MTDPIDLETLWCVHVQGPDTLIPQPDHATAEKRAAEWNELIRQTAARDPHPYDPLIRCEVVPYPGSAESHARGIAEHGGQPGDIC